MLQEIFLIKMFHIKKERKKEAKKAVSRNGED